MNAPVKMLLVFVNEVDHLHGLPVYQALVQRLRQLEIAGATAVAGLMGFGRHHRVHHRGLFGISDDRPFVVVAVDEEAKLRAALPEVRAVAGDDLVLLVDAEIAGTERPDAI